MRTPRDPTTCEAGTHLTWTVKDPVTGKKRIEGEWKQCPRKPTAYVPVIQLDQGDLVFMHICRFHARRLFQCRPVNRVHGRRFSEWDERDMIPVRLAASTEEMEAPGRYARR